MSDDESSASTHAGSDVASPPATVEMFQCRKCPGKLFTSAEKDVHRKMHKDQKRTDKGTPAGGRKPGPRSRRASSPVPSERTLFDPVTPDSQNGGAGGGRQTARTKRGRADEAKSPAGNSQRKKIKSKKRTNEPISFDTTTGG